MRGLNVPISADKAAALLAENAELRERVALLNRELDSVVAIVHDRAPELIEAVVAVVS